MADMLVRSDGTCLIPTTKAGLRWVMSRAGDTFVVRVLRERSVQHHRKFFALVNWVAHNHPTYNTTAKALDAVKFATGHVHWEPHPVTGALIPIPKSISFESMEQEQFAVFYEDAIKAVLEHLAPEVEDHDEFIRQVSEF